MTRAGKKIGLLHHVGGGNLGDDATLDAVACNIKLRWPNAEIVAFSMNPDDTARRHGIVSYPVRRKGWSVGYTSAEAERSLKETVKALTRRYGIGFYFLKAANAVVRVPSEVFGELSFWVSSHRNMKTFDLLIVCGGGQLTEKDGPWGFPYTIFKWVVMARSAGARCIVLNVGAGPLAHPVGKFFVTRALQAADYVSFRDDKSRALVHEIGFAGESRVYPDSAYALEVATRNGGPLERRAQLVVGFAPMPYPRPRDEYLTEKDHVVYDEFVLKVAAFASRLLDQSYALTFFGTDIGVDPQAIDDLKTALVKDHSVSSSQYNVNRYVTTAQDLLETMSGMDYIVTCRFHGVIFAHLLNKPVLAIAPHPKVANLMTDLELSDYCVDIQNFDAKLLAERFASMVLNAEEIKSRMATSLERNKKLLKSQFDELFRF